MSAAEPIEAEFSPKFRWYKLSDNPIARWSVIMWPMIMNNSLLNHMHIFQMLVVRSQQLAGVPSPSVPGKPSRGRHAPGNLFRPYEVGWQDVGLAVFFKIEADAQGCAASYKPGSTAYALFETKGRYRGDSITRKASPFVVPMNRALHANAEDIAPEIRCRGCLHGQA